MSSCHLTAGNSYHLLYLFKSRYAAALRNRNSAMKLSDKILWKNQVLGEVYELLINFNILYTIASWDSNKITNLICAKFNCKIKWAMEILNTISDT